MAHRRDEPQLLGITVALGAAAGVCLWLLTIAVSRSHISGSGWSLAGNGALIIPFGIGPALVTGGWTAIILRIRQHPRWLRLALGSAAIGLALVAGSLLALVVLGPANRDIGAIVSVTLELLVFAWMVASPIGAAMIDRPAPSPRGFPTWPVVALLLLPVTLIAGCVAGTAVVPT